MSDRFTALAEWKSTGDSGELSGYMSVFNVLDEGGDVVVPGAFKKTFDGWNRARSPMPLIADHQLDTDGVIGSVMHMAEDGYGASIRARFSSVAKAQSVRTKMVEGHLNGLSFTYNPIRFHHGTFAGQPARFLDEVRVFEATVTPFPMNELALASAKAGHGVDVHDVDEQLVELERWARMAELEQAVSGMLSDPDSAQHALGVLQETRSRQQLAELEAWALSQPPRQPVDPDARRRARWERDNAAANRRVRIDEVYAAKAASGAGCGACGPCRTYMPQSCVYR